MSKYEIHFWQESASRPTNPAPPKSAIELEKTVRNNYRLIIS